ncbi:hypothetical protein [Asticcacaulis tiandongensis]|uniref:hypothetical protein n=1 Tax=Asticcacaulis tiandongensis TaxID=2565365 RepID=UPI001127A5A2|nr:hypothetical protein [Asticcacaulis tiandongensis]
MRPIFKGLAIGVSLTVISAPVYASKDPLPLNSPVKVTVYTLEPEAQGVVCENGTRSWPAELVFPAGLLPVPQNRPVSVHDRVALQFDVLKNGRLTNIQVGASAYPATNFQYLPLWAAAWSLDPRNETLKGCRMRWKIRSDYAPEMAAVLSREALHLRTHASNLKRPSLPTDACRAAGQRLKTRVYPDKSRLQRKDGQLQWIIERFNIDAHGKVDVTATVGGQATPENRALVTQAVAQHNYYPGDAAEECLISYVIQAGMLPVDDAESWNELRQLHKARALAPRPDAPIISAPEVPSNIPDSSASDTCPPEALRQVVTFVYKPEDYPSGARRHRIEGLAYLVYDIAPWGELKVRSQWGHPLPQFAQAAENMLRQSEIRASDRGLSGCQLRVKFIFANDASADTVPTLIGADGEASHD